MNQIKLGIIAMLIMVTTSCRAPIEQSHEALHLDDNVKQAATDPFEKQRSLTHTVKTDSPYYVDGPHQGAPPNGQFVVGTKLKVHDKTIGSYILVENAQGIKGYVDQSNIIKAHK